MRIAIGNDHVAVEMKHAVKKHLEDMGHSVLDHGTGEPTRADYPHYAVLVAKSVISGMSNRGILICGTGIGISIAANKIRGIRAAVCSDPYSAKLSRQHNNSNILAFGARVIGVNLALMIVDEWLAAAYEGTRHQRRLDMISDIERLQLDVPWEIK